MLKKNKILLMISALVLSLFPTFTMASSVSAAEEMNTASTEDVEEMAKELEYIFTNIIVEDPVTGEYKVDKKELDNSSYSESEKDGFVAFAQYMNNPETYNNAHGVSLMASNVFERCMADALGIGGSLLNEFMGYVEKEQWIAAAGILAVGGIAVHPAAIFAFALTCGPSSAS